MSEFDFLGMVLIGRAVFTVLFLGIFVFVIIKLIKGFSNSNSNFKIENIPMGSNQDFAFQQMHDNAHRIAMDMHNTAMHEHMSAHNTAMHEHMSAHNTAMNMHENFTNHMM